MTKPYEPIPVTMRRLFTKFIRVRDNMSMVAIFGDSPLHFNGRAGDNIRQVHYVLVKLSTQMIVAKVYNNKPFVVFSYR